MDQSYKKNSITLLGGVSMGVGVMIGAGIFALTGQIAELAGPWFPLSFVAGAVVTGFSAYAYVKMSNAWPSAGGIAMILEKTYGPGAIAAAASVLMALSMIINESLVARTFGAYALRPFSLEGNGMLVSVLGVLLIIAAYLVNALGARSVGTASLVMAVLKIGGVATFGIAALWAAGGGIGAASAGASGSAAGFAASVALAVLAFKGFTTITNSGAELVNPERNVGRAILASIAICTVVYLIVAFAVRASLSIEEIVAAKDFALASAAEPTLGALGFQLTVALALVATASGLLASMFAVSRMLTMLTKMKMVPHSHFGMPGPIRDHMLVYTAVLAALMTVLFDLGRIASLGVFFYLVMDVAIQFGVLTRLRSEIGARAWVLITAITLDVAVLGVFGAMKLGSDPWIVVIAAASIGAVFVLERYYLRRRGAHAH